MEKKIKCILKIFGLLLPMGLIGIGCSQKEHAVSSAIEFTNLERYALDKNAGCDCVKKTSRISNDIKLEDEFPDMPCRQEYAFERKTACRNLSLLIGATRLRLDSVYLSKCANKDIVYIPAFLNGKFLKKRITITISLNFLNEAINSSSSTLHTYTVVYDEKLKKVQTVTLKFEE